MVSRESKNNVYVKISRPNKDYYGIFESGRLESGLMTDKTCYTTQWYFRHLKRNDR